MSCLKNISVTGVLFLLTFANIVFAEDSRTTDTQTPSFQIELHAFATSVQQGSPMKLHASLSRSDLAYINSISNGEFSKRLTIYFLIDDQVVTSFSSGFSSMSYTYTDTAKLSLGFHKFAVKTSEIITSLTEPYFSKDCSCQIIARLWKSTSWSEQFIIGQNTSGSGSCAGDIKYTYNANGDLCHIWIQSSPSSNTCATEIVDYTLTVPEGQTATIQAFVCLSWGGTWATLNGDDAAYARIDSTTYTAGNDGCTSTYDKPQTLTAGTHKLYTYAYGRTIAWISVFMSDCSSGNTLNFTASPLEFSYTGAAQGPTITATDEDGNIVDASNYAVTSGTVLETDVGDYSFTVEATGNYTGSASFDWVIHSTHGNLSARAVPSRPYEIWFNPSPLNGKNVDVTP
jgi:hypothetical protein